jgi:ssDNA-binding Zn-finger/Zn-ribbon topoisomerase 1
MDCANCGKSYPATYFRRHKCKGQPILRKDFPCTVCDVVCSFKSNIIRHYKEVHSLEKDEIPLSVMRIKREKKPRKPCPTCGKALTQLSNHKCKGENLIAPQPALPAAVVSLERLSDTTLAKYTSKQSTSTGRITRSTSKNLGLALRSDPIPSTSTGGFTRSAKQATKAVVSLDRHSKKESSPSSSESDASSSSAASADEDDSDDDDDVDDAGSDISHDSIAKPKSTPKKVGKKLGKSLPPRTATWRSPADIPPEIKEHIRAVYSKLQFSKIMDHQVRMRIDDGSFDRHLYEQLLINSVGRAVVDAVNLIKLVYDEQRSRPRYISPAPN